MKPWSRLVLLAVLALPAPPARADPAPPANRDALYRQHAGGVLRLSSSSAGGTLDPQINYQLRYWQVFAITYDGLVTFKKARGDEANIVVPDLADAMPLIGDGGRSYQFHLRSGVRFSNGQLLTPADVVASFVRLFKVASPNSGTWYNVIAGGDACVSDPDHCTLHDGVVANLAAGTITFHLVAPDIEFLQKLSCPFASIVPANTPARDVGTTPVPTTGPYQIASYDPTQMLRLTRNPLFTEWSIDAQPRGYPDEIDYAFGLQAEAEVSAVLNGQQDWMFEDTPVDRLADLGRNFARQVHIDELVQSFYLALNTNLAPFNNPLARLAVAYAVDRRALVKLFGGSHLAAPLCQQLPHGIPGYAPYCPFTLNPGTTWTKPDMGRARALIRQSGTIGQKVTLITEDATVRKSMGEYLRSLLQSLGYRASLKAISQEIQFTYIQNTNNRVQISLTDWNSDYAAPSDFLNVLFSCSSFHPGTDASVNIAGYCDPTIDAAMRQALVTSLSDQRAANLQWADIDRRITAAAPAIGLFQPDRLDLVSARVGNFVWSGQYHLLFSQAWVR